MSDTTTLPESGPRIAVFGATGLVADFLFQGFGERTFPVGELGLFASERSVGKTLVVAGKSHSVRSVTSLDPGGFDLAFFAATGELSRELAPRLARAGALVVDKSSTWRLDPGCELVVPELRREALPRSGIVASPNCTTVVLALSLEPLRRLAGLARVTVTSLQAASGAGRAGLEELRAQRADPGAGSDTFGEPLLGNVVPLCDALEEGGWSGEERKLERETRRLLGLADLCVEATCTRVPVETGHGVAVVVETLEPVTVEAAGEAIGAFPGLQRVPGGVPTPLGVAGRDEIHVGRLRALGPRRLAYFAVGDNLRKGAATNALQIAEAWWESHRPRPSD